MNAEIHPSHEADFEAHRPLLFAIAYRMLGSAMEAEDIVQEAYLRYRAASEPPRAPKAYLTTVVTRLCLDHLKSARVQREAYFGPWLPEPLLTDTEGAAGDAAAISALNETLSMAFLVLLEKLNPLERAVFLLHEVFAYGYAEIAAMVGRNEATCRQALHRARAHLASGRRRFHSTPEEHRAIFGNFLHACALGELDGLLAMLSADAVAWSDGGGKASAAIRPVVGAARVAAFMRGLMRRRPPDAQVEFAEINGRMGVLIRADGAVVVAVSAAVEDGKVAALWLMRNPDKLRRL
jgi:RNA polymerase sigma-70 factor (ECF subfamily)